MAFNSFGQTTNTTTPGTTSQLNTGIGGIGAPSSLFGTVSNQANPTFGTPVANSGNVSFGGASTPNTTTTPLKAPTFGTNPSFFGSTPNAPVSQPLNASPFATGTDLSIGGSSFTQTTSASAFPSILPQSTTQSGTLPATTSTGSLFGSLLKGTPSTASTGFVNPTTQATAFSIAPLTTTSSGLSSAFGAPATSQPSLFGAVSKTISSISQTQPTSTSSLSFPATTTSSSLFSALNAGTATSTPATTTSLFGAPAAATTTSAAAAAPVFMWQKTTSEPTSVSSTTSIGLGGVDHVAVATTQSLPNMVVSAKEQPLPTEIQQTIVAFKEYVKTQKNLSSEVARSSAEPLGKLTQQIGSLNNLILTLGSVLSQQKFTAEKIKIETIKSLNDYELAQKIKDSPVASEERMLSIRKYFGEKISVFEESTKILQEKIEYVYQHVITLAQENSLSAEALKVIVKKLHDSFVVIGARAYKLHNDMQLLKVQYLTLRNQYVRDNSAIPFSVNREVQLPQDGTRSKPSANFSFEGPNPFSRTGNVSFNQLLLSSQNKNFAPTTTTKDWSLGGLSNAPAPFNFTDFSSSGNVFDQRASSPTAGQQFTLQKPPSGNKRGKR